MYELQLFGAFTVKIYKYEAVRFSTSVLCLPVCNNRESMNSVLLMLVWGFRESVNTLIFWLELNSIDGHFT